MLPRLVVRPASGDAIGLGHLRRCLALAEEWIARGGAVTVVIDDVPASIALAEATGADVVVVHDPLDTDALTGLVVVDGYAFDSEYQTHVREQATALMVLDDRRHLDRYDADLLLNQNPGVDAAWYDGHTDARLLIGPRYALIRKEIRAVAGRASRGDVQTVLVTGGGADPTGVSSFLLEALASVDNPALRIRVAVGPFQQALVVDDPRVELIRNADMAELMREADLALAAAGSVALELACVGVPMGLVVAADNQGPLAAGLAGAGAAVVIARDLAAGQIESLLRDAGERTALVDAGRSLVDGLGVERVAAELASFA